MTATTDMTTISIHESTPMALDWLMHMHLGHKVEVVQNCEHTCLWDPARIAPIAQEVSLKTYQTVDSRPVKLIGEALPSLADDNRLAKWLAKPWNLTFTESPESGRRAWRADFPCTAGEEQLTVYGETRNQAIFRARLLVKHGEKVVVPRALQYPMVVITEAEFESHHACNRDTWTTERTDWPDWEQVRHRYMGMRTLMRGYGLHVEGISMVIVP